MKRLSRIILFITATLLPLAALSDGLYTTRTVPVQRGLQSDGQAELRFYPQWDDVPYISARQFHALMLPGGHMQVESLGDGEYQLTTDTGAAHVNVTDGTLSSPDLPAFTNLMGQIQPGMDNAYLDRMPYIRYVGMTLAGSGDVTLNFGDYDIALFADGDDIYFPLPTLANLYSDLYYHWALYNGDKLILNDSNYALFPDALDGGYYLPILTANRSEAMAAYSLSELRFCLDHYFGGTDVTFDNATGAEILPLLGSADLAEYLNGLDRLGLYVDDGHCYTSAASLALMSNAWRPALWVKALRYTAMGLGSMSGQSDTTAQLRPQLEAMQTARKRAIGTGTYYQQGDTAICVMDTFDGRDEAAWRAYYAGNGPRPTTAASPNDSVAILLDALDMAAADPQVTKFVLDLTCNPGGSADAALAVMSLLTGESTLYSVNTLTGQQQTHRYDIDRNFDGIFDERDADVHYDFQFALLVSRWSFSCANLCASLAREAGIPLLGEHTRGGACAVQLIDTGCGAPVAIPSWRMHLTTADGLSLSGGVDVDYTLYDGTYDSFYDLSTLSDLLNRLSSN